MSVELEPWARRTARDLEHLATHQVELVQPESDLLARTTQRLAPLGRGALRRSILARGLSVLSIVPYAVLQSEGGTVKALRHGWLTIPVRPGYVPGPGYVTVRGRDGNQYVIRSGTRELWAIRRRSVLIRGNRYLDRALSAHIAQAGDRVADRLERAVKP